MDIREYLKSQGLGDDEIASIVGNEKTAKAMSSALGMYEQGTQAAQQAKTDLESAKTERDEATRFWDEKVTPALANVDTRVASANSEAARYRAYLETLKQQGYDVPADLVGSGSTTTQTTQTQQNGNYVTREDFGREMNGVAPNLITLTQISNEYSHLLGAPYLSMEDDYREAQKAHKPFSDHVRNKYGFEAKKAEKAAAADQARIDKIVEEQMKVKESALAAKYGSNPELRSPMPSKFDRLQNQNGFKSDSWKSPEGRKQNREERLKRFENVTIQ